MIIDAVKKTTLLFILTLIAACSSSDGDGGPAIEPDTEAPVLTCPEDITVNISATDADPTVNYTTPVGTDNMSAITSQTEGLPSGASFPEGVTTNTYRAIDAAGNTTFCSFDVTVTREAPLATVPYFVGDDPTPAGKTWVKLNDISDEFDTPTFDDTKWENTNPSRWIGRAPGIFKANTVSQADGNLKLTSYQLDAPEVVNGTTFTHAGSNIYSRNAAQVGTYTECRMKANKTFMSSTFWLINNRNEGTGCDVRVTELDIQECVGQITGTANFAQSFDTSIHSNTHSRQTACTETPTGSRGDDAPLGSKVYEDYHVYGCWWKSATEVFIYLDGEKVYEITPAADFSLPMYLRLVIETYDWNPVPADGGMTGTEEERTTYYDWVRSWELQDE